MVKVVKVIQMIQMFKMPRVRQRLVMSPVWMELRIEVSRGDGRMAALRERHPIAIGRCARILSRMTYGTRLPKLYQLVRGVTVRVRRLRRVSMRVITIRWTGR